jgi:hypothetical protein
LRALPVSAESVIRLLHSRDGADHGEGERINRGLPRQVIFLPHVEGKRVGIVGDIKIGDDAEHALLLFVLDLLLRYLDAREVDVYRGEVGGDRERDRLQNVNLTGVEGPRKCLRREAGRCKGELKVTRLDAGKKELPIAAGSLPAWTTGRQQIDFRQSDFRQSDCRQSW